LTAAELIRYENTASLLMLRLRWRDAGAKVAGFDRAAAILRNAALREPCLVAGEVAAGIADERGCNVDHRCRVGDGEDRPRCRSARHDPRHHGSTPPRTRAGQ